MASQFLPVALLVVANVLLVRVACTWVPRPLGRGHYASTFTLANVLTRPFSLLELLVKRSPARFQPAARPYDPSPWNGVETANCYAYALDLLPERLGVESTWVHPGEVPLRAQGRVRRRLSWWRARRGFALDGLARATLRSLLADPGDRYLVAALLDPQTPDFHLLRLDRDGRWSHKPGRLEVTRLDSAGRVVVSPRRMVTTNKYWFVGYFWVHLGSNPVARACALGLTPSGA